MSLYSVVAGLNGSLVGRDDAPYQRAHDQQQNHQAKKEHHQHFDTAHDVVLGELQERHEAGGFADRRGDRFSKPKIDDFDLIAAFCIETDPGANQ